MANRPEGGYLAPKKAMNRIHQVLIPTDFSPCAQNAFRYAQHLAVDDDRFALTGLHVPRHPPDKAEQGAIKQRFADMKALLPNRLRDNSEFLVKEGDLIDIILTTQRERNPDLIVMGTDGSDNETKADSRTARLVLEADCPVLVIPAETPAFRVKQIALALDENDIDDESSLGVVHDFARWFGAKVHLLTINSSRGPSPAVDASTESTLEYYLQTLDYRHVFPENTDIVKGIEDYIRENDIDLLAILPRNHAQKTQPSEGRLTKLLALHSPIPLLAID